MHQGQMENIVLMCHVSHSLGIDAKLEQMHVGKKIIFFKISSSIATSK